MHFNSNFSPDLLNPIEKIAASDVETVTAAHQQHVSTRDIEWRSTTCSINKQFSYLLMSMKGHFLFVYSPQQDQMHQIPEKTLRLSRRFGTDRKKNTRRNDQHRNSRVLAKFIRYYKPDWHFDEKLFSRVVRFPLDAWRAALPIRKRSVGRSFDSLLVALSFFVGFFVFILPVFAFELVLSAEVGRTMQFWVVRPRRRQQTKDFVKVFLKASRKSRLWKA